MTEHIVTGNHRSENRYCQKKEKKVWWSNGMYGFIKLRCSNCMYVSPFHPFLFSVVSKVNFKCFLFHMGTQSFFPHQRKKNVKREYTVTLSPSEISVNLYLGQYSLGGCFQKDSNKSTYIPSHEVCSAVKIPYRSDRGNPFKLSTLN